MRSFQYMVIALIALSTWGCSVSLKRSPVIQGKRYFSREQEVQKFKNVNGMPAAEPYAKSKVGEGDSFDAYALVSGANAIGGDFTLMYLTVEGSDSVWVSGRNIVDGTEWECMTNNAVVTIPKSESDDAWGRATVYVNKHSTMKIQVASDNIIDTFNPTDATQRGYTITRRSAGDKAIIEIEVKGASSIYGRCSAYSYIKYGK